MNGLWNVWCVWKNIGHTNIFPDIPCIKCTGYVWYFFSLLSFNRRFVDLRNGFTPKVCTLFCRFKKRVYSESVHTGFYSPTKSSVLFDRLCLFLIGLTCLCVITKPNITKQVNQKQISILHLNFHRLTVV